MKLIVSEQQVKNLLNKLADKAMSVIQKKEPITQQQNTNQVDVYTTTKNEWSKINSNMGDPRGFGEGTSPDQVMARRQAIINAELVMLKKMGLNRVEMGINVENEKTFKNPNNTFTTIVIVNKTQ
jgi:hypothetical protein